MRVGQGHAGWIAGRCDRTKKAGGRLTTGSWRLRRPCLVAVPPDGEGLKHRASSIFTEREAGSHPPEASALHIGTVEPAAEVDGTEVTG